MISDVVYSIPAQRRGVCNECYTQKNISGTESIFCAPVTYVAELHKSIGYYCFLKGHIVQYI